MVQKPTIYLYGKDQVPLPKLPDWDSKMYPCAVIVLTAYDDIFLLVSDLFTCNKDSSTNLYKFYSVYYGKNYKKYALHGTEFVEAEIATYNDYLAYRVIWTNCDMYAEDALSGAITDELTIGKDDASILDVVERSYYLFNGMLLPAFPELPYDYVVISLSKEGVHLYCSSTKYFLREDGSVVDGENSNHILYVCTGAVWMDLSAYTNYPGFVSDPIFWSNHAIIDVNGTVGEVGSIYFPKSADPVPFEPEPQLNPAALMQEFATMMSLRRNRT